MPDKEKPKLKIFQPLPETFNLKMTAEEMAECMLDPDGNYDWSHIPDGPISEDELFED
jgi:hypothetical protein